jgi:hypothetical protein
MSGKGVDLRQVHLCANMNAAPTMVSKKIRCILSSYKQGSSLASFYDSPVVKLWRLQCEEIIGKKVMIARNVELVSN